MPLLACLLVVLLVAPLRRTVRWARLGRLRGSVLGATGALIAASTSALVLDDSVFRHDVAHLAQHLPLSWLVPLLVAGALFCLLNALLEEVIFWGVLLGALTAAVGPSWALCVQAAAFGVGHAHGYPPGPVGVILASVFGLLLGLLRGRWRRPRPRLRRRDHRVARVDPAVALASRSLRPWARRGRIEDVLPLRDGDAP